MKEMPVKMKFEEGDVTRSTMNSFLRVLGEICDDDITIEKLKAVTRNNARFDTDKKSHDVGLREFVNHKENIERDVFIENRYKSYDIVGTAPIDMKMNQIIWRSSIKRVSFPSMLVRTSSIDSKTPPSYVSLMQDAVRESSTLQVSNLLATNKISRGAVIIRASDSTWMTNPKKSKSFPNYKHFVFDAAIMTLKENIVEKILTVNKGLRRIIKGANRKTRVMHRKAKGLFNYSGMSRQRVTRNGKVETNKNDVDVDSNLKTNDINNDFVPENTQVKYPGNIILKECDSGGSVAFSCSLSMFSSIGGIVKRVDDLMKYYMDYCRKKCQLDEKNTNNQEATRDPSILTISDACCHVVSSDKMEVMDDRGTSDSLMNIVELKNVEVKFKQNHHGDETGGSPSKHDDAINGKDRLRVKTERQDIDMSNLERNSVHFDKEDVGVIEKLTNIVVVLYLSSNMLPGSNVVEENANGGVKSVNTDANALNGHDDQYVKEDVAETLQELDLDTDGNNTPENVDGSSGGNPDKSCIVTSSEHQTTYSSPTEDQINAIVARLDKNICLDDESLHSILSVFCRSGLHTW